ncbi:MAG TPA: hemerythrin domain-containing protein [Actinomycetales bacterium]|nr:hemerythrin domain-containing protein [Actinomycetales bacterium]
MEASKLSQALEREHHEIDASLASLIREASDGDICQVSLHEVFSLLRRHIYLEETILFPPLRAAGLLGPVLVMLREHGEIWRAMVALEEQAGDDATHDALVAATERLLEDLARHNAKEEPILYPQADLVLDRAQQDDLRRFMESGHMPDGWVAQQADRRA